MDRSPTVFSRTAAAFVGVLALALLAAGITEDLPAYARVILLGICLVTAVTTLALQRDNSFAARLVALGVAGLSAAGAVLVGTVGLPGRGGSGFDLLGAAVVGLGLAIAILLALDARSCPATDGAPPPYAL